LGPPLLLFLLLSSSPARAQDSPATQPSEPTWEIEPYVGVARHSPAGTHLGTTPDRNHLFLGVHVTGTAIRWRRLVVAYAPEVVPLLLLSNTPTLAKTDPSQGLDPSSVDSTFYGGVRTVAGIAVSPVGFEARVRVGGRLRLYTAMAAGFAVFGVPVPLPGARRFNYTFEGGGGMDFRFRLGWWLRAGYKFHHLSNGNSSRINPGVDAKVVMIGISHGIGRR
jgi:hypothetical protein